MLKIKSGPIEFSWPVTYYEPGDGRFTKYVFNARFLMISNEEFLKLTFDIEKAKKSVISEDGGDANIGDFVSEDKALIRKVFLGWDIGELKDEDNEDIICNDTTMDNFLSMAGMPGAIMNAYMEARSGPARKKT